MAKICINDEILGGTQYGRLSSAQCQKLHNASLEILARTGARLYEQEAIDLLEKAGESVADGNLVRVPAGLRHNEQALQKLLFLADKSLPALHPGGRRRHQRTGDHGWQHGSGQRRCVGRPGTFPIQTRGSAFYRAWLGR